MGKLKPGVVVTDKLKYRVCYDLRWKVEHKQHLQNHQERMGMYLLSRYRL
jgi:hypothetical protein